MSYFASAVTLEILQLRLAVFLRSGGSCPTDWKFYENRKRLEKTKTPEYQVVRASGIQFVPLPLKSRVCVSVKMFSVGEQRSEKVGKLSVGLLDRVWAGGL